MKRGFLLDKNKPKKAAQPKPQPAAESQKPVTDAKNATNRYTKTPYGKVDFESRIPKSYQPNFTVIHDVIGGTIKSESKSLILVTVPPKGSPAAEDEDDHSEWITIEATKTKIFDTPEFPKPFPKPVGETPLYEVKTTPDMGMGVFATREIKVGELVFAERPLLVAPANINVLEMKIPPGDEYVKFVLDEYEKVLASAVSRMSTARRAAYQALMNSHTEDGSGPLTGIMRTNGYIVGKIFDGPGPKASSDAARYSVVGNIASRINHSCVPNVLQAFDLPAFAFTFKAFKDIKAGDQLFYSYCSIETSVTTRQMQLAPYGIVCKCRLCIQATPESNQFRDQFYTRVGVFKARNAAALNGTEHTWPNDEEFDDLVKFQETATKEALDQLPGFCHVLGGLALGYGRKGMHGQVNELIGAINKIRANFPDTQL